MTTYVDEGLKPGWNWAMRGRRDRDRIQGVLDGIVLDGRLTWTELSGLAEALAQTDPSHRRHWPLSAIDGAVRRWLGAVPPGAVAPRAALEEFQALADAPPPNEDPFDDDLDPDDARHVLQAMIGATEGVVLDGVCTWTELEQMSTALEDLPKDLRDRWPLDRLGDLVAAAVAETPPGGEAPTGFVQELARMVRSASIGRGPGPARATPTGLLAHRIVPDPVLPGARWALTGGMALPRARIVAALEARGAIFQTTVSGLTDYLAVGAVASRHWIHGIYGRKIEAACARHPQCALVAEETLLGLLDLP
jgi:hypothetical protein